MAVPSNLYVVDVLNYMTTCVGISVVILQILRHVDECRSKSDTNSINKNAAYTAERKKSIILSYLIYVNFLITLTFYTIQLNPPHIFGNIGFICSYFPTITSISYVFARNFLLLFYINRAHT